MLARNYNALPYYPDVKHEVSVPLDDYNYYTQSFYPNNANVTLNNVYGSVVLVSFYIVVDTVVDSDHLRRALLYRSSIKIVQFMLVLIIAYVQDVTPHTLPSHLQRL